MVFTRSQIENLSREELMEEFVKLSDITDRLKELRREEKRRRETMELNPVPQDIHDNVQEDTICKFFLLTGQEVVPKDLHPCYRMSNHDRVIVKFKDRKLKHNTKIKFTSKIFRTLKILCFENHQLAYN